MIAIFDLSFEVKMLRFLIYYSNLTNQLFLRSHNCYDENNNFILVLNSHFLVLYFILMSNVWTFYVLCSLLFTPFELINQRFPQTFLYTGPYIYNNLPHKIRDYSNYAVFKLNLSNWLFLSAADISPIL